MKAVVNLERATALKATTAAPTMAELAPHDSNSQLNFSRSSNPLTAKAGAVLSTTYSDAEFREALDLLDQRGITNDSRTRRQIRLDLQKDVIDCNGTIIGEFAKVAEVCYSTAYTSAGLTACYGNSNYAASS